MATATTPLRTSERLAAVNAEIEAAQAELETLLTAREVDYDDQAAEAAQLHLRNLLAAQDRLLRRSRHINQGAGVTMRLSTEPSTDLSAPSRTEPEPTGRNGAGSRSFGPVLSDLQNRGLQVRVLPALLLLCVHADERGRTGRVVVLAVHENVAVEGHLTGRGRLALLPLASRPVDGRLQRSDACPGHVEGDLVGPTEVVPGDSRSGCRDALEILGARDGCRGGRCGPAERRAVRADGLELHPGRGVRVRGLGCLEVARAQHQQRPLHRRAVG